MKIKRTVKDSYLGIPLKYAGETETIGEDRMDRIIRGTLATQRLHDNRTPDAMTRDAWASLKSSGKLETFYANYELLEA